MRLDPGVSVEPGAIRISDVTCVIDHPNVRIWNIEMHTKYAEFLAYDSATNDDGVRIHLWAGDHAIKLDARYERNMPTTATLPVPNSGHWEVTGDTTARYSLRIVVYQLPEGDA